MPIPQDTREITLTQGKVAIVDAADYARIMQWKWCASQSENAFYAVRWVSRGNGKGTNIQMHREVLGFGPDDPGIDHHDGDGLHNWRTNLRPATTSQNACNRGRQSNNTSGYIGVWRNKSRNKWCAEIWIKRKKKHVGHFDLAETAARARDAAAIEYYGEFAVLNFPRDTNVTP
jgi:hypothetical protein